ncbi:MAG: 3-phosphoshikimate 1-carboxyvinyltransferase [Lysobacterales bacterium]|jgi:3-phosphoshikimate 1-carboxyvinyltransferase
MILTVEPARGGLRGVVTPPGDKSISHRALILSSLADGCSEIRGLLESEDTLATLRACQQLGAAVERDQGCMLVTGTAGELSPPPGGVLDLGNSGTAMRLLAGVLSGQGFDCELSGDASLNSRPMRRIVVPLRQMGANISATEEGTAPLKIRGTSRLKAIDYESPVASAQIKSCVLLAGLFAEGRTSVAEPRLSRDHTERMLPLYGVELPAPCAVDGGARLQACNFDVPADISSAVFALAAAAIVPGSRVTVHRVGLNPTRTGFLRCLAAMGADVRVSNEAGQQTEPAGDVSVAFTAGLHGIDVPQEWVPDMIDEMPLLMALAATASGTTRIRGAAELRVKESDRIAVMAAGLKELGVDCEEFPDGMDIRGGKTIGGRVASAGDHRCAMSFAILALAGTGDVIIEGAEYIATSYPGFSDDMNSLGANMMVGG